MPRTTALPADLRALAAHQGGCLSRAQLRDHAVDADRVAAEVRAGRWCVVGPLVVRTCTGALDAAARRWAAVLSAGEGAALSGLTALEVHGLRGWERPSVAVRVARGHRLPALVGVVATSSRRPARVVRRGGLPLLAVEDAAVGAAGAARSPATAGGLLAAVVQQRLTTPARLRDAVLAAGPVRHRRELLAVLDDVEGGAQALSEVRLVRLCRTARLPAPAQQVVRLDGAGRRRYLDALWVLDDGRRVLLEVDGVRHVEEARWYDDLLRAAEVAQPGEVVLRLPARALRVEPARVVALLRRHLGPGGCTRTA
ncbi:hypothetical protein [uncultured Pseudokineococcus sp.]|uniref:hypothetical protein n=1 Tax=uncultured Pseudokineococcus sp. TaxID=1642928 RepID=UPI002626C0C9|nr:hypothetical protein [uncultured Pseudokineococcus sp.]